MTRLVILVGVILGPLAGGVQAQPMDGEAAGRLTLELVGFLLTAFLFYVAFSGAIMAVFSRAWRHTKQWGLEPRT